MNWSHFGLIALFILLAIGAALVYNARRDHNAALRAIRALGLDEIPLLSEECVRVFHEEFAIVLNVEDLEGATAALEQALATSKDLAKLLRAFGRKGLQYRFVLPIGAFAGELIKKHTDAKWKTERDGAIALEIERAPQTWTIHPFDKMMKIAFDMRHQNSFADYVMTVVGRQPIAQVGVRVPESEWPRKG